MDNNISQFEQSLNSWVSPEKEDSPNMKYQLNQVQSAATSASSGEFTEMQTQVNNKITQLRTQINSGSKIGRLFGKVTSKLGKIKSKLSSHAPAEKQLSAKKQLERLIKVQNVLNGVIDTKQKLPLKDINLIQSTIARDPAQMDRLSTLPLFKEYISTHMPNASLADKKESDLLLKGFFSNMTIRAHPQHPQTLSKDELYSLAQLAHNMPREAPPPRPDPIPEKFIPAPRNDEPIKVLPLSANEISEKDKIDRAVRANTPKIEMTGDMHSRMVTEQISVPKGYKITSEEKLSNETYERVRVRNKYERTFQYDTHQHKKLHYFLEKE